MVLMKKACVTVTREFVLFYVNIECVSTYSVILTMRIYIDIRVNSLTYASKSTEVVPVCNILFVRQVNTIFNSLYKITDRDGQLRRLKKFMKERKKKRKKIQNPCVASDGFVCKKGESIRNKLQ